MAPGAVPVLGHALRYKKDPPGFMVRPQCPTTPTATFTPNFVSLPISSTTHPCAPGHAAPLQAAQVAQLGGVFRVNLAGLKMTICTDPAAVKAVATAPTSVLSLKHAVSDFGFRDVLGGLNVHLGTDVHRSILKGAVYPALDEGGVADVLHSIEAAVDRFFPGSEGTVDAVPTLRRVLLSMSIELFIGPKVLDILPGFLEEYIRFQDGLEDAIAKATVLPFWLARLVFLAPVERVRKGLEQQLAGCIASMWADDADDAEPSAMGTWTKGLKGMKKSTLPGWKTCPADIAVDGTQDLVTADEAASLVVGLLFAAHKNPAIGAAQALLFLLEPANATSLDRVRVEVGAVTRDGDGVNNFDAKTSFLTCCVSEALVRL